MKIKRDNRHMVRDKYLYTVKIQRDNRLIHCEKKRDNRHTVRDKYLYTVKIKRDNRLINCEKTETTDRKDINKERQQN